MNRRRDIGQARPRLATDSPSRRGYRQPESLVSAEGAESIWGGAA
jgi:hypothetical protein